MAGLLGLEPDFQSGIGLNHTFRCKLVATGARASICETMVTGTRFFTSLTLPDKSNDFTFFHGHLTKENGLYWITGDDNTTISAVPSIDIQGMSRIVETCAGIAAVDQGYAMAGAQTVCYVDQNPHFTTWLKGKGYENVITGNVAHADTTRQVMQCVPQSHILSGGFACQPFSGLGDQLQERDSRSESLTGILRMSHQLGSLAVILECTKEAANSEWVRRCLAEFMKATGYTCAQQILTLQDIWTANRTRWWAVLAHTVLQHAQVEPLPGHRFQPTVTHLVPRMLDLPDDEHQQLQLDDHELLTFREARGGLDAALLNPLKTMPTATHSLGSQCCPCACGCRRDGFSRQRLKEKGLHGIIMVNKSHDKLRHPHPVEIGLCNGLVPSHVDQKANLKLMLAGAGQMASPFQGAWVLAGMQRQAYKAGIIDEPRHPRLVMLDLCHALLRERDRWWPDLRNTRPMKLFLQEIIALVSPVVYASHEDDEEPSTQEWVKACEAAEANLPDTEQPQVDPPQGLSEATARAVPKPSCAPRFRMQIQESDKGKTPSMQDAASPAPEPAHEAHHDPGISQATEDECPEERGSQDVASLDGPNTQMLPEQPGKQYATTSNGQDGFDRGAVPGFGTRSSVEPPKKKQCLEAPELRENPDNGIKETHDTAGVPTTPAQGAIHIVRRNQEAHCTMCSMPVLVSHVVSAENELNNPVASHVGDFAGNPIASDAAVHPGQVIMIDPHIPSACPNNPGTYKAGPPCIRHLTRAGALWQQQGWVADDEMEYYLKAICHDQGDANFGVVNLMHEPDEAVALTQQILTAVQAASTDPQYDKLVMMVLHNHHWTPVMVQARAQPEQSVITTTSEMVAELRQMVESKVGQHEFKFQSKPIAKAFLADCGFQSVAWLLGLIHSYTPDPMTTFQAGQWRTLFHRQLLYRQQDQVMVQDPLELGGGKQGKDQLIQLITHHGVAEKRGMECAEQLIQALGMATIQQILQSPRPWQDLKSRATLHRPPLRIVTAEELKEQINARATSRKPVGRKQNKVQSERTSKPQMQVPPDQIIIPHAVFKQDDGQEVGQLTVHEVGPKGRGVWVASVEEALPYLKHPQVSQEGILLLVPSPYDPRLPEGKQIQKVPAQCRTTSEPMLVTMATFQIGAKQIVRNMPMQCPEVPQVDNQVMRLVAFQDQWQGSWADFAKGPVKAILAHEMFADIPRDSVLDVWDRQFLSNRMTRSQPDSAMSFAVNMRLTIAQAKLVHEASGTSGLYAEPRTADGRSPDPKFQVVWAGRKNFAETKVMQKTIEQPTFLVRHAERYGLRVQQSEAQAVHQAVKPEVPFLPGTGLTKFRVGPLPYGATRTSLLQVCKLWNWAARPISPISQSNDRSGTIWMFQATHPPPSWVYQMQHGEILITQEQEPEPPSQRMPTLLASDRTWQSLKKAESSASNDDPWVHGDPWQHKPRQEVSVGQMHALEQTIEKRVLAKIQTEKTEDIDMPPVIDARVSQLEQRLEDLTTSVTAFQNNQAQQNQQVQSQLHQIDGKVESTAVAMKGILDNKLDERMRKIEQLLTKRPFPGQE
eukprot:Skav211359  [mRNA]  locus=scaffold677:324547:329223:- [translate_table: standard]